jgi:hypothetical protein
VQLSFKEKISEIKKAMQLKASKNLKVTLSKRYVYQLIKGIALK